MNQSEQETQRIGLAMIIIAIVIALAMFSLYFQDAIEKQYNPNQSIDSHYNNQNQAEVILQRNRSGHYVGTGLINKTPAVFLLDTGATYVAIPENIAQKFQLKKGRQIQLSTANGRSIGYQTLINELSIGKINLYNIKAIITPNLEEILLGMSALKQLSFTQQGKQLTIKQTLTLN